MIKIVILLLTLIILTSLVVVKISNFKPFNRIPKLYLVSLLFCITLLFLLLLRFISDTGVNGTYVPAKFDGNELIGGKIEFEK